MQLLKSLCFSAIILFATFSDQETVKLNVESNHSTVGFMVRIAGGITKVRGKFLDFQLEMDYVDEDVTKSNVKFTIQATSIDTGIEDRDNDLRTKTFFDTEKFPEITFVSSFIRKKGDNYEIEGDFTMHGTTKRVIIPFVVTNQTKSSLGISLEWSLNRKEYGVGNNFKHTSMKNFISDNIEIEVDFWTRKAKNQGN
jgi:polyisoprenoid-binding protein YceI